MKARKCYRRALELDPLQAAAGAGLCDLLHDSNSEDLVHGVCTEILEACPSAEWARRRLGQHHLWTERPRDAIRELQVWPLPAHALQMPTHGHVHSALPNLGCWGRHRGSMRCARVS